jgi:hypothetical protein
VLFPALWALSPSRLTALLVSAGYFLAASRGLPQGVANFYAADLWPGLLLWAAASLSFAGTAGKLQVRGIDGGPQHLRYIEASIEMHAQMSAVSTLISMLGYIPTVN